MISSLKWSRMIDFSISVVSMHSSFKASRSCCFSRNFFLGLALHGLGALFFMHHSAYPHPPPPSQLVLWSPSDSLVCGSLRRERCLILFPRIPIPIKTRIIATVTATNQRNRSAWHSPCISYLIYIYNYVPFVPPRLLAFIQSLALWRGIGLRRWWQIYPRKLGSTLAQVLCTLGSEKQSSLCAIERKRVLNFNKMLHDSLKTELTNDCLTRPSCRGLNEPCWVNAQCCSARCHPHLGATVVGICFWDSMATTDKLSTFVSH